MGNGFHCNGEMGSCEYGGDCTCDCGHCRKERGDLDWDVPLCLACRNPLTEPNLECPPHAQAALEAAQLADLPQDRIRVRFWANGAKSVEDLGDPPRVDAVEYVRPEVEQRWVMVMLDAYATGLASKNLAAYEAVREAAKAVRERLGIARET